MDGPTIQARIYAGRGKAAQRIGLPCQVFRPTATGSPFTNQIATLNAAFNSADPNYVKPNLYGKAVWFSDLDGRFTRVGDYLVRLSDNSYWFIAAQQQLLPIVVIACNRIVNVFRPQQQSGVGAVGYGGDTVAQETPLITGYPASVLVGTKSDKSLVNLPGDVRNPAWAILLPVLPANTYLRNEDVITDDQNRRYVISSAELTDLGWRINAAQAET
jgi:hypothetical protein